MDMELALRDKRKELVLAAERTIKSIFATHAKDKEIGLRKTQLNHLVGVCGEAACTEEIENYIRYQASRRGQNSWRFEFADLIINAVKPQLEGLTDLVKVEAWKLYAIFLARAFTFEEERRKQQQNQGKPEGGNNANRGRQR